MNSRGLCVAPESGIESQPEIIQPQLVAVLVEDEAGVGGVIVLCVLVDFERKRPSGFL